MIVYIDSEYKVHLGSAEGYVEVSSAFFDRLCPELAEAYRFVPANESWIRSDGEVFSGEMIAPYKDIRQYDAIQREYEQNLLTQYEAALSAIEQALEVQT